MPLHQSALTLIRSNLEAIQKGERVSPIVIGNLTKVQLDAINQLRAAHSTPLAPVVAEVIFFGSHIYKNRVEKDGYTIDDILAQIESAFQADAVFIKSLKMTVLESPVFREDPYGNRVQDRAVFECTLRHPRPELFSVIPKGDTIKPSWK